MRYSIEPKDRHYVEKYVFLSFSKRFGNKYGRNQWILQQKQA